MNKKNYRKGFFIIIATAVILLGWPKITDIGKSLIRSISFPAERMGANINLRASDTASMISGIGSGPEREKQLSLQLVQAQSELNRLRNIESENVRLRKALGFKKTTPYNLIPANVINRNISGWWNTIRLEPGANKKIKANHAVLSPDGLVGKTFQINRYSCEVLLLSDPAFRVAAKLSDYDVFGIVKGMGKTLTGQPLVRMEFINKNIKIEIGDEVVTSGFNHNNNFFPSGIHIGYIEKIYIDDSGLFQHAEIIPRATGGLLDFLFIADEGKN